MFFAVVGGVEERVPVGRADHLRSGLAAGIGIVAAEGLVLAVAPEPFLVLVAFVGGDDDHGTDGWAAAYGVQEVGRPHHVRFVGQERLLVAQPHQRLRRHVNDDLGAGFLEDSLQEPEIADVAHHTPHPAFQLRQLEKARHGRGGQRIAREIGPEIAEPGREPGALEAGMAGQKDALTLPETRIDHAQTFQEALPSAQSFSSSFLSRSVSIGRQKPSCLKAPSWPSRARPSSGSRSQIVESPSLIYSKMPGSHTKNPALIHEPSPFGFSSNAAILFPAASSIAPKRPWG